MSRIFAGTARVTLVLSSFLALVSSNTTGATQDTIASQDQPIVIENVDAKLRKVSPRMWAIQFAPDYRTVGVTAGWHDPAEPGELILWDFRTGKPKFIVRQNDTIRTLAFSHDAILVAVGDFAGNVQVFDFAKGKLYAKLPKHANLVNCLAFTPNDSDLITGSFDNTLQVWDVEKRQVKYKFTVPDERIVTIAISPESKMLAAATWEGKVHIWDLGKRAKLHTVAASVEKDGKLPTAEALAFNPDGSILVTGAWDSTVRVWDTASGRVMREPKGHKAGLRCAAFAGNGKTFATADESGNVIVWDTERVDPMHQIKAHQGACHGLVYLYDSKRIATAAWDRTAKIWDIETAKELKVFTRPTP